MPQLAFLSAWHRNFALHIDLAVQGQAGLHLSAAEVGDDHLRRMAPAALRHRLRRNPLDDAGSGTRVARAVDEVFAQAA